MPHVHITTLPSHVQPIFPDRCVVCRADQPEVTARLFARDGFRWHKIWDGWSAVQVPCCRSCRIRLRLWWAWDVLRTLLIGGTAFAIPFFCMLPRGYEGWVCGLTCLGLAGVGFIGVFIWNWFLFPPAFNMDRNPATIDYLFRDQRTWEEFNHLNGAKAKE